MLKKKFMITSYLVLALGLSACSTGNVNEPEIRTPADTTSPTDTTTTPVEKTVPKENDETDTTKTIKENNDIITTDTTQSKTEDLSQYKEIKLTATQAYNIFLEKKPGSKVEKISLDYDNKIYYYEVEGYDDKNEYEIKLDAVTATVVKEETEMNENNNREITLDQISKIDELVLNAMQDAGDDFESLEWELEIDNGKPILEIEVERKSNDLEYTYDIETGSLLDKE